MEAGGLEAEAREFLRDVGVRTALSDEDMREIVGSSVGARSTDSTPSDNLLRRATAGLTPSTAASTGSRSGGSVGLWADESQTHLSLPPEVMEDLRAAAGGGGPRGTGGAAVAGGGTRSILAALSTDMRRE